jgi:hypothetical protein
MSDMEDRDLLCPYSVKDQIRIPTERHDADTRFVSDVAKKGEFSKTRHKLLDTSNDSACRFGITFR